MAFDIQSFRAEMDGDGARPNLFEVYLNMPSAGFAGGNDVVLKMTMMCRAASLPASTIGVVQMPYFGRTLNFAGNRTFEDWTVTVINDENFMIRNAIERWMNAINSHRTNLRDPRALRNSVGIRSAGYTADGLVIQYGKTGSGGVASTFGIKKYKFIGMFPVALSEIALDWSSNDQIEEFSVTFSYQWWEAQDIGGVPQDALTTT